MNIPLRSRSIVAGALIALLGMSSPLLAGNVAAATGTLSITVAGISTLPALSGPNYAFPVRVINGSSLNEKVSVNAATVTGSVRLPATILSARSFSLPARSSCYVELRYDVSSALLGSRAAVAITAIAKAEASPTTGRISVKTAGGAALTVRLGRVGDLSVPTSFLPNRAAPVCGSNDALESPSLVFQSLRVMPLSNPPANDQYTFTNAHPFPLTLRLAPATVLGSPPPQITYLGAGSGAFSLPANGACVVLAAVDHRSLGSSALVTVTALGPVGSTGGTATYQTYTDLTFVASKPGLQFDDPSAYLPLCQAT
jgi:hypothetical protein